MPSWPEQRHIYLSLTLISYSYLLRAMFCDSEIDHEIFRSIRVDKKGTTEKSAI
jgi:hypothetical protein